LPESLPLLLVPGLMCSARLFASQVAALWPLGPVTIADHRRDDGVAAIAARILTQAPPRFALAGLSLGGYIAFAIMRLAPERVGKLALLNTSARPDTPEQTAASYALISMAESGRLGEVTEALAKRYLHRTRWTDEALRGVLREMAADTGADAFVRQERAIIARPDSRPLLAAIRCPTLVLAGDGDELIPRDHMDEIAGGIAGATFVVVPECGHLSTLERPEAVNAALAAWLED
jgi:pimeloyl-ACP methyl ester carboxylesterase